MLPIRWVVLALLLIQNVGYTLLRRYSQGVLNEHYSSAELLMLAELVKLAFSAVVTVRDPTPSDAPNAGLDARGGGVVALARAGARKLFWLVLNSGRMMALAAIYGARRSCGVGPVWWCASRGGDPRSTPCGGVVTLPPPSPYRATPLLQDSNRPRPQPGDRRRRARAPPPRPSRAPPATTNGARLSPRQALLLFLRASRRHCPRPTAPIVATNASLTPCALSASHPSFTLALGGGGARGRTPRRALAERRCRCPGGGGGSLRRRRRRRSWTPQAR